MGYVTRTQSSKQNIAGLWIISNTNPHLVCCELFALYLASHRYKSPTLAVSLLQVGSRVDKVCSMPKRKMPSIQALNRHKVIWSIPFIYQHLIKLRQLVTAFTTPPAQMMHHGFIKVFGTVSKLYSVLFFIASLVGIPLGVLWFSNKIFPTH